MDLISLAPAVATFFGAVIGGVVASLIARRPAQKTAAAAENSAKAAEGQAHAAIVQAAQAEDNARSARTSANAAETAAKTQADALMQTRLEEAYRSFRWAADVALNDDTDKALVGITLLAHMLIVAEEETDSRRTPQKLPREESRIVIELAVLRANVAAFMIGMLLRRVEKADNGGIGTLTVDHMSKAIAAALAATDLVPDLKEQMKVMAQAEISESIEVDTKTMIKSQGRINSPTYGREMEGQSLTR